MYEKYDANVIGAPGGGGEYDVQIGFGWTNGLVLEWLQRFGRTLPTPVCPKQKAVRHIAHHEYTMKELEAINFNE